LKKCFFCDRIIVPLNIVPLDEVEQFFKDNKIEFTLNFERSKRKIGNKIICFSCENDIAKIFNFQAVEEDECEDCKQKKNI